MLIMAIIKLNIDDFDTVDYSLFAIHTNLADFRLAYFINKQLNLQLIKNNNDIAISDNKNEVLFTNFIYNYDHNATEWTLFENKKTITVVSKMSSTINLFSDNNDLNIQKTIYLMPEFKNVNYFLKINHNDAIDTQQIIVGINNIIQVNTAYYIDTANIKNKNNLIF